MLVKFCNGYLDPARVEAVLPASNGKGHVVLTCGGNTAYFPATEEEMKAAIMAAGLIRPERGERA